MIKKVGVIKNVEQRIPICAWMSQVIRATEAKTKFVQLKLYL